MYHVQAELSWIFPAPSHVCTTVKAMQTQRKFSDKRENDETRLSVSVWFLN